MNLSTMTTPTLQQITTSLTTIGFPTPSADFLNPLLTAQPPRPLPALIATAKHRLLSSNLVPNSSNTPPPLDPLKNSVFPINSLVVTTKEIILAKDVCVQVLDIDDLGKSKWEQIETLEAERKGEMTKGREVIRVVQDVDAPTTQALNSTSKTSSAAAANKSYGSFKLLLQDMKGQKVYGFELKRVEKIGMPGTAGGKRMSIGCKVMLKRGTRVARGVVLLEPQCTVVLGGKIEGLDKAWREGREARLREEVGDVSRTGRRPNG